MTVDDLDDDKLPFELERDPSDEVLAELLRLRTELRQVRYELHRARISVAVAIGLLPPELVDRCAEEIDRQTAYLTPPA